jgi:hypothetical protein
MAVNPNTDFSDFTSLSAAQLNRFPRGVMAYVIRDTGNLTISAGATDLTGMSVTFTAVANRLYKATWLVTGQKQTNAGYTQLFLKDGANVQKSTTIVSGLSSDYYNLSGSTVLTLSAGSQTLKLTAESQNNSSFFYATSGAPMILIIEDTGPT